MKTKGREHFLEKCDNNLENKSENYLFHIFQIQQDVQYTTSRFSNVKQRVINLRGVKKEKISI